MISKYKPSRLSIILLILAVPPFFCGGIARTIYQYGGPLWLNLFADVMGGIAECCVACVLITITINDTKRLNIFVRVLIRVPALMFCLGVFVLSAQVVVTQALKLFRLL